MRFRFNKIWLSGVLLAAGCTYKEIPTPSAVVVDCTNSTLKIVQLAKVDATGCLLVDGSFTVAASGGTSPYVFSLNGADFHTTSTFSNLGPGYYQVTVRDASQCERPIEVEITAVGSTLVATHPAVGDNDCLAGNGSVTVTASGGTPPYTYQLGSNPEVANGLFENLKAGFYQIKVRDNSAPNGCYKVVHVQIARLGTGTKFSTQILPIINTYCAKSGCHNGDLGPARDWSKVANAQAYAKTIKQRTGDGSMPLFGGPMTQDEIDLIACWVDDGAKDN